MRRFNVTFSEAAYNDLQRLAERKGKTMAQVLRDSIALMKWYDDQRAQGNHILIESPTGQVREVVPVG